MGTEDQEQMAAALRPLMTAAGLPITKQAVATFFTNRHAGGKQWNVHGAGPDCLCSSPCPLLLHALPPPPAIRPLTHALSHCCCHHTECGPACTWCCASVQWARRSASACACSQPWSTAARSTGSGSCRVAGCINARRACMPWSVCTMWLHMLWRPACPTSSPLEYLVKLLLLNPAARVPTACTREWPLEALSSVARNFCGELELGIPAGTQAGADGGDDASLLPGVVTCCVAIHQSVERMSKKYLEELRRWVVAWEGQQNGQQGACVEWLLCQWRARPEGPIALHFSGQQSMWGTPAVVLPGQAQAYMTQPPLAHVVCFVRRYNYVTPTSYLELLTTFLRLLGEKRSEISQARARLTSGLQKLSATAAQVRQREGRQSGQKGGRGACFCSAG